MEGDRSCWQGTASLLRISMPRKFMLDAVIPPDLLLGTHWGSPNPCSQWALLHPTQELGFSSFSTSHQPGREPRGTLWFVLSLQCCGFLSSCRRMSHLPWHRKVFCSINISFHGPSWLLSTKAEPGRGARGTWPSSGGAEGSSHISSREEQPEGFRRAPLRLSLLVAL